MPSPEKLCPVTQQGLAERMGSAAPDSGGVTHQWPVQNAGQQAIPAVQSGPTQLQGTSSGPCPTADSAIGTCQAGQFSHHVSLPDHWFKLDKWPKWAVGANERQPSNSGTVRKESTFPLSGTEGCHGGRAFSG